MQDGPGSQSSICCQAWKSSIVKGKHGVVAEHFGHAPFFHYSASWQSDNLGAEFFCQTFCFRPLCGLKTGAMSTCNTPHLCGSIGGQGAMKQFARRLSQGSAQLCSVRLHCSLAWFDSVQLHCSSFAPFCECNGHQLESESDSTSLPLSSLPSIDTPFEQQLEPHSHHLPSPLTPVLPSCRPPGDPRPRGETPLPTLLLLPHLPCHCPASPHGMVPTAPIHCHPTTSTDSTALPQIYVRQWPN